MSYQNIHLSKLLVNVENDRHGSVKSEKAAIQWHFDNLKLQAIKLAKDITGQEIIYEPPLVSKNGGRYIVRDGNRRITCLKALADPTIIQDENIRKQFLALNEHADPKLFREIECRVERDENKINEIVHRRHTGGASGVGQVKWGPVEKENYLRRIGKADNKSIGYLIAQYAKDNGIVPKDLRIPTSTVQRLLSSEDIRNRIGVRMDNGRVFLNGNEGQIQKTLKQILEDFASQEVILKDVWNNEDKNNYLDSLTQDGFAVQPRGKGKGDSKKKKTGRSSHSRFAARPTLIPKELELNLDLSKPGLSKVRRVWDELQMRLFINSVSHPL